jgi:hypothetical protein
LGAEHIYAVPFEAFVSAGGQVVSPGPVTLEFDTVRLQGCERCVFHDQSEIEVLVEGTLIIESSIGIEQYSGNGRTITEIYIEHQPQGDSYALVGGSYGFVYTRNSNDGNYQTARASAALRVGVGDRIRVLAGVKYGSGAVRIAPDAGLFRVIFVATNE